MRRIHDGYNSLEDINEDKEEEEKKKEFLRERR